MEQYTKNNAQNLLRAFLVFGELALLQIIFQSFAGLVMPDIPVEASQPHVFLLFTVMTLSWLSVSTLLGYYNQEALINSRYMLKTAFLSNLLNVAVLSVFVTRYEWFTFTVNIPLLYALPVLASTSLFRFAIIQAYRYRRVFFKDARVMIVGSGQPAVALHNFFENAKAAKVLHVLNGEIEDLDQKDVVEFARNKVPELKQLALDEQVSEIYCTLPLTARDVIEDMADFADNNYINFKIASDFNILNRSGMNVAFFDQTPIITLRNPPLASFFNRQVKRVFDLIVSGLFLLLVFPWLYIIIGILIKLDSPGPVFFIQTRAGKRNQMFKCFKFRTMGVPKTKGNGIDDYQQATKNDPRITKVGAFLRKTSLDELPQFLNVFLGDMSVIGPRPHPPKLDMEFNQVIRYYQYRYYIKPGISGWAQVNGYRGETDTSEKMEKRVEFDNWYIENWTPFLDFKILFMTVFNMVQGEENAY
ncbi:MAG: exopolysaccharide biosynthesis polyprenyl glycosylphosphotransferase [Bacteroidetes bacterium]|nr:exopolysaccharide biosynthesis polyprenyl glycosylphosphotransferase [Bacteroidota bacterium]MCB0842795.1 exopolysaccharide biosynthesis polyprenyl glycosylphosphotransferase [Bacteroidota bacterium]